MKKEEMHMKKGKFVVITGPSAAGKTDTVKGLLELTPSLKRLVTTTSRTMRDGEVNGVDYNFVSREQFIEKEERDEFLESTETYGNLYGSTQATVEEMLSKHPVVLSVLDIKGARKAKEKVADTIVIFVLPGSLSDIKKRLGERSGVSDEETKRRTQEAFDEIRTAHEFDHVVNNIDGEINRTIEDVQEIINSL